MTTEVKIQAELAMRTLQAAPGADVPAIAKAFQPLLAAIAAAQKTTARYETK